MTLDTTRKTDPVLRESALQALQKVLKRTDLGFFQLPERNHLWAAAQARADEIRRQKSKFAVIGIGGSAIGAQALLSACAPNWHGDTVFFDNVDAVSFHDRLQSLGKLNEVHWILVSKSGRTAETLVQADFVAQILAQQGIKFTSCATVISEMRTNPLSEWAKLNKVPLLEIPEDVGGRYSVLTSAGLLPAALNGIDLGELKAGARWGREQTDLIAELAAQSQGSWHNDEWITLFWSYCDRMRWWGAWIQQLWAESLGKKNARNQAAAPRVSTPIPALGACDQHSILQQVAEGYRDKFVWFFRVKESEHGETKLLESQFGPIQSEMLNKTLGNLFRAEAEATRRALVAEEVHSLTLGVDDTGPKTMGALFMILELVVATLGELLNINAFDQPGVEQGKKLARMILENEIG